MLEDSASRSPRLVEVFLREAPGMLAELDRAVLDQHPGDTATSAHKLKGAALALGANALAGLAVELERTAAEPWDPEAVGRQLAATREGLAAVLLELRPQPELKLA